MKTVLKDYNWIYNPIIVILLFYISQTSIVNTRQ